MTIRFASTRRGDVEQWMDKNRYSRSFSLYVPPVIPTLGRRVQRKRSCERCSPRREEHLPQKASFLVQKSSRLSEKKKQSKMLSLSTQIRFQKKKKGPQEYSSRSVFFESRNSYDPPSLSRHLSMLELGGGEMDDYSSKRIKIL